MIRSPVLGFQGVGAGFRVERWLMPVDAPEESYVRLALIWDDGDDQERVVLLGRSTAMELAATLTEYGTEDP